ncbi:hypothetical protein Hanom_Chr10g00886151 [Helianthus anomalus]
MKYIYLHMWVKRRILNDGDIVISNIQVMLNVGSSYQEDEKQPDSPAKSVKYKYTQLAKPLIRYPVKRRYKL